MIVLSIYWKILHLGFGTIDRSGTVHDIGMWFDALLAGIGFSNAPGQPECIYGNAWMPLTEPVDLDPGDRVSVTIQANPIGEDYLWSWQTQVTAGADPQHVKADFKQSTFYPTFRTSEK